MKSTIQVSAAALRNNFAVSQAAAGPGCGVLCVLKANAYGHGAALCAPVLVGAGAQWLGVGDLQEGIAVRQALDKTGLASRAVHVLVMCGFEVTDAPELVAHGLTPTIWTAEHVEALERAAAAQNLQVAVHVEVDTGMARQGVAPGPAFAQLLAAFQAAGHVRLEGIFTHLSSSEVAGSEETTTQLARFGAALEQLDPANLLPEYLHLGNSSAMDEHSTMAWIADAARRLAGTPLVRPGLALYGYTLDLTGSPSVKHHLRPALTPVATWVTHIIGLRSLRIGDTVGYGATFTAPKPMHVALLPTGYADGFRREASSGVGDGWVMIAGQRAPVLGRVSMNLTVIDVTGHTPALTVGDEVVLLGPGVSATDHAGWCRTIPYEILCGMQGHRRLV